MAPSSTDTDLKDSLRESDSISMNALKEQASDEDTEDASETEVEKKEGFTGIKEQMYRDKLAQFRRQLEQLKDGSLPVYVKKLKRLNQQLSDRLHLNKVWSEKQLRTVEEEYENEKVAALKEFEEKKIELRESLIQEYEMKKKMIENERNVMELTGDTMAVKPANTRKLRRRPNDPVPVPEKRGKPSPELSHCLEVNDIIDDIFLINKLSGKSSNKVSAPTGLPSTIATLSGSDVTSTHDASIEEGRLLYDKKWYSKDQAVVVESREFGKVNAIIVSVTHEEILMKKILDNTKLKVPLLQLQTGLCTMRKRTS